MIDQHWAEDALCFRESGGRIVAENINADDDPAVLDCLLDGVVSLDFVPLGHNEVAEAAGQRAATDQQGGSGHTQAPGKDSCCQG